MAMILNMRKRNEKVINALKVKPEPFLLNPRGAKTILTLTLIDSGRGFRAGQDGLVEVRYVSIY